MSERIVRINLSDRFTLFFTFLSSFFFVTVHLDGCFLSARRSRPRFSSSNLSLLGRKRILSPPSTFQTPSVGVVSVEWRSLSTHISYLYTRFSPLVYNMRFYSIEQLINVRVNVAES